MENTAPLPAEPVTLAQIDAVRRDHAMRLLDVAEVFMQGLESLEAPKDLAAFDRAGKALLSFNRALKAVHETAADLARTDEVRRVPEPDEPKFKPSAAHEIFRAAQSLRLERLAILREEAATPRSTYEVVSTYDPPNPIDPPPRHRWP